MKMSNFSPGFNRIISCEHGFSLSASNCMH